MATSVNLGRVVGYSAYEIAVQNGFVGTEAEWLASLKGETGPQGPQGETGPQGPAGPTYTAGTGIDITNNVISATGSGGASSWNDLSNKPFSTVGSGLTVTNDVLTADPSFDENAANQWMEDNFGAVAAEVDEVVVQESATFGAGETTTYITVTSAYEFSFRGDVTLTCDSTDTYTLVWDDMYNAWQDQREGISLEPMGGSYKFDIPSYFSYTTYTLSQTQEVVVTPGAPFEEQYIPNSIARLRDIPGNELPTISSGDAGKVLTVNSGETGVEWAAAGGGSGIRTVRIYKNAPTNMSADDVEYLEDLYQHYSNFDGNAAFIYMDLDAPKVLTFIGKKSNYLFFYGNQASFDVSTSYSTLDRTFMVTIQFNQSTNKIVWVYGQYTPRFTAGTGIVTRTGADANVITVENPLPAPTASDANKVLTATGAGAYSWQTPSGGGGTTYTAGAGIDIDATNDEINVLTDGSTIDIDGDNQLYVAGNLVPEYSASNFGQVLGVVEDTNVRSAYPPKLEWVDLPEGIPDYSRASEGDVLSINRSGDMEWMPAASGGGDVLVDETTEASTSADQTANTMQYLAPRESGVVAGFENSEYLSVDSGVVDEEDNPVYTWELQNTARADLSADGFNCGWEDVVNVENYSSYYSSGSLGFSVTVNEETTDPDTGDPVTEQVTRDYDWSPDHIQLKDQVTGDVYELTIRNGQINIANISQ